MVGFRVTSSGPPTSRKPPTDVLADPELPARAERGRGQVLRVLELEQGDVKLGIAADHLGDELPIVGEVDAHIAARLYLFVKT